MAMSSSPENPQALSRVVGAVADWVGRLGEIWVRRRLVLQPFPSLLLMDCRVSSPALVSREAPAFTKPGRFLHFTVICSFPASIRRFLPW